MRIAILGASSQIATDLVSGFFSRDQHELVLFARRPDLVMEWQSRACIVPKYSVYDFSSFTSLDQFDVVINFVGVGNPAQALAMGPAIFDVTYQYDELALSYLRKNPDCRYIFLSSGAAYGATYDEPVSAHSSAKFELNNLRAQDWYGAAKFHAECRHRAHSSLSITDLRVFNYFSHTQDMGARFLITDILRAIQADSVLEVSADSVVRDYLHPNDFHQLVSAVLGSSQNLAIDCYSKAPVDKATLLETMQLKFCLQYRISDLTHSANATGVKPNYFSLSRRAADFGYDPSFSSLEGIVIESRRFLGSEA